MRFVAEIDAILGTVGLVQFQNKSERYSIGIRVRRMATGKDPERALTVKVKNVSDLLAGLQALYPELEITFKPTTRKALAKKASAK